MSSREGDGRGGPELMVEFRGRVGRDLLSECPLQNSLLRWDGPRMQWCFLSSELPGGRSGQWRLNNSGGRVCQWQCASGLC